MSSGYNDRVFAIDLSKQSDEWLVAAAAELNTAIETRRLATGSLAVECNVVVEEITQKQTSSWGALILDTAHPRYDLVQNIITANLSVYSPEERCAFAYSLGLEVKEKDYDSKSKENDLLRSWAFRAANANSMAGHDRESVMRHFTLGVIGKPAV